MTNLAPILPLMNQNMDFDRLIESIILIESVVIGSTKLTELVKLLIGRSDVRV